MKKILIIALVLIVGGYLGYKYFIWPGSNAVSICEESYRYYPETGTEGAYHTAVGVVGNISKFDSREDALDSCIYKHRKFYKSEMRLF